MSSQSTKTADPGFWIIMVFLWWPGVIEVK